MGHLTLKTLARLVSEAPTAEERQHLSGCLHCTGELEALREQSEALSALPDLRPPRGDWEVLEARLVSEGLIRRWSRFPFLELPVTPGWMQAAAGLVLFLGGVGLGVAAMRGDGFLGGSGEGTAANIVALDTPGPATGLDEAAQAVRVAERQYMESLFRYRQMTMASGGEARFSDPAGRFAALDALVATSQAAVRQAPADPFLNGILISALAERQATLSRISAGGEAEWF